MLTNYSSHWHARTTDGDARLTVLRECTGMSTELAASWKRWGIDADTRVVGSALKFVVIRTTVASELTMSERKIMMRDC